MRQQHRSRFLSKHPCPRRSSITSSGGRSDSPRFQAMLPGFSM
jgi:hypothetical protein